MADPTREGHPRTEPTGPVVWLAQRAIALQLAMRVAAEEAKPERTISSTQMGDLTVKAMIAYTRYIQVPQEFIRFGIPDLYVAEDESFTDLLDWLAANQDQWEAMSEKLAIDAVGNLATTPVRWA